MERTSNNMVTSGFGPRNDYGAQKIFTRDNVAPLGFAAMQAMAGVLYRHRHGALPTIEKEYTNLFLHDGSMTPLNAIILARPVMWVSNASEGRLLASGLPRTKPRRLEMPLKALSRNALAHHPGLAYAGLVALGKGPPRL